MTTIGRAKRLLCACAIMGALVGASAPGDAATRTVLNVYTALEPEQHGPFKAAIEAAVPEVEIHWVWAQTGEVTDRLFAERADPKADIVLGLAATSMIALEKADLLLPYKPRGAERLREQFRDPKEPYTWTGMDAYLGVLCVNNHIASEIALSGPVSWRDLLVPGLKGRIAVPDPVRTGTGYLLVAGWLQSMGESEGWAYMDALDRNVAAYLPTGAGPCLAAAEGHYAIGMTYDMRAALIKEHGAPIRIVVPIDGVGWEEEAFGIMNSSPRKELARKVADWAVTREANELYAQTFAMVADPDLSKPPPNYPPYAEARMIRNDLAWMAANRPRILAEWTRRYGAKSIAP